MTNQISLDIQRRRPFADGVAFGDVGAYECLNGQAKFAVDPDAASQLGVVDLKRAAAMPKASLSLQRTFLLSNL